MLNLKHECGLIIGDKMMIKKFGKSVSFAWAGIKEAFRGQSFRIMLVLALLAIVLGVVLRLSLLEWVFLVLSIGFVLALEIINTAWELSLDYLRPDINPLAGKIKDLAAGAVLVASLTALVIGLIIFLPKILEIL